VTGVGEALLQGPFNLQPPRELDDYGWLERELGIVLRTPRGVARSVAVYVEATADREENLLPPVLRMAQWNRQADIRRAQTGKLAWPTERVRLGSLAGREAEVDLVIRALGRLAQLPFAPFGLGAHRPLPGMTAGNAGHYQLYLRNGIRSVEFEAPVSDEDGGLSEAVLGAVEQLASLGRPIEPTGWRESYPYDLDRGHGGAMWTWSYGAPEARRSAR
jgi:hypothetical protein